MRAQVIIAVVAVMILGFLAYRVINTSPQPVGNNVLDTSIVPSETITPQPSLPAASSAGTIVQLDEENSSGESGPVTLSEIDGKVRVSVSLAGAPLGVSQPIHIHLGSCPDVGNIKYTLTPVVNGKSETNLNVSLAQLKKLLPLAINVHKSVQQVGVYVACGNILFTE
jgi:hypothetical protein